MMAQRHLNRWLMVALMAVVAIAAAGGSRQDAFRRLDSLISAQPQIVAAKEVRLAQLKNDLAKETTAAGRYKATKRLYEEYSAYQYDSAYAYVSECLRLAQAMGDDMLMNESRLNLAHILSTACLMGSGADTHCI